MSFSRYEGPRRLADTSIDDIPLVEQADYWATRGESGEMSESDADRLYADWYAAQERQVAIGDYVRSYDFDGRDACYVEGTVRAIMNGHYEIEVTRRVWEGVEEPVDEAEAVVAPPINGLKRFGRRGVTDGVKRMDPPQSNVTPKVSSPSLQGIC